ncbi:MAG: MlaD family protein [Xanthobacteraceae bacterium]
METRAPFVIVGAFVLAAIAAVFGFVYWLHNTGGVGPRTTYQVQFDGAVPGLLVGAAVLFNGIRVGEVTSIALAADHPRRVNTTIAVASDTPVRPDTKVGLEFQGLTGVPVVSLEGGQQVGGTVTTLIAEPGAGQSMTQAARDALRKVDTVLAENADPLKSAIANLQVFSEGLARNTGKIDGILTGIERMTGGGAQPKKVTYDLKTVRDFSSITKKALAGTLAIPEPTAILMLDTQRFLFSPPGDHPNFAEVTWADNIPKLVQARLIQSFENFDLAHTLRGDAENEAEYRLVLDIRRFRIETDGEPRADIALSARIVHKDGKLVAARLFEATQKIDKPDPAKLDPEAADAAFNAAFTRFAKELTGWVAETI